jgi:hypothetical protein
MISRTVLQGQCEWCVGTSIALHYRQYVFYYLSTLSATVRAPDAEQNALQRPLCSGSHFVKGSTNMLV